MKFGHFDDARREYVITTPQTPWPWINYLGCENFFSLISNTAGGYSFYRDARLRRITRYRYNNVPLDAGGRYFYLHDDDGAVWSPGWMPTKTALDHYECRHGLGYTQLTGARRGVTASLLAFVPLGADCEVQQLRLRNDSAQPRHLKVFSFVEFCLWNALDDMTNFQRNFSTGEVEVEGSALYHKTEYRERRNHFAFYWVNAPVTGFDTDRESFLGRHNGFHDADVPVRGQSRNSIASGWSPIGSHSLDVLLAPGEERAFVFVLGYIENPTEEKWAAPGIIHKARAIALQQRFATSAAVEAAVSELRRYWDGLLSRYATRLPEERLARMVNIWNAYQVMITFNLSRSASYFESGIGRGMGFRDSTQDLLGFVHMIPDRARERLLDIAATQLEDGGAYHQYQPLTKRGNNEIGGGFNDDPLWLIASTIAYVQETGDHSILDELAPFDNDENRKATLFEHLQRSFYYTVHHLGPHGLPLIGRADWNDCLNLNCFSTVPGDSFQTCGNKDGRVAESVFIAGMFVLYGAQFAELCRRLGRTDEAKEADRHVAAMRQAVLQHGWDGAWFLRAYDDAGEKIGSQECAEGQIFIEPQGLCIMAGIGLEDGKARQALDSVKERLETQHGIVLQQPSYATYHLHLGEISSYPPGYKENAGIFCHNNPWIIIAETLLGRGDRAFDLYRKIAPAYVEDISDLHRTEPYVFSQMVAGRDAVRHGEAKNSWLTGTAAWTYVAVTQWILGIRAEYDGLRIDPCIPASWDGFEVTRQFRSATYRIRVHNPRHVNKGVLRLEVNGQVLPDNLVPLFPAGQTVDVHVTLGNSDPEELPKRPVNIHSLAACQT